MTESPSKKTLGLVLVGLFVLAGVLVFILIPTLGGTAPSAVAGTGPAVTTPTGVQAKMVHVTGENHGLVILVGRTTCPWCMKTKELLANMSVDYYWIDLNLLDGAETAQVLEAVKVCGQTNSVPILLINGDTCILGYQEEQIREALK
jgi:glutaredoxin-like protein NrdH